MGAGILRRAVPFSGPASLLSLEIFCGQVETGVGKGVEKGGTRENIGSGLELPCSFPDRHSLTRDVIDHRLVSLSALPSSIMQRKKVLDFRACLFN
jgi:hypothetical protein